MIVDIAVVGYLEENCYVLKKGSKCLVIDPGAEIDKIREVIGSLEVVGVLITHRHFDHIGALSYFDKDLVLDYSNTEEKKYKIDDFIFNIIRTPGHTSDSISYYFKEENKLFSGDFIFLNNIGRCDMPTGDFEEMKKSINKIKTYPKDMIIYPGHGDTTTLENEIENNIYF